MVDSDLPSYAQQERKSLLGIRKLCEVPETLLNDHTLSGPDINNNLRDVLIRFRNEPIGFSGDIEMMFRNFHIKSEERDFTRFYWFSRISQIVTYASTELAYTFLEILQVQLWQILESDTLCPTYLQTCLTSSSLSASNSM